MDNSTKKTISDALSEMIIEKPFDRITITDLVERCGISRQTFYYHFSDLMDVLEWVFNEKIEAVVSECVETRDLKSSIRIMLGAGLEYQGFLHILLESRLRGKIEQRLLDAIKNGLASGAESLPPHTPRSDEDISNILDFVSYGIIGLLLFRDVHEIENLDFAAAKIYNLTKYTLMEKD